MFGGDPPSPTYTAKTEFWNGTSWTEVGDLGNIKEVGQMDLELQNLRLLHWWICKSPPSGQTAVTEEFTAPLANKTITAS